MYIWLLLIIASIVLCFKNTVYGCSLFLLCRILVPEIVRLTTPWFDISLNTGMIAVMACFCIRDIVFNKKSIKSLYSDYYIRVLLAFAFLLFITVLGGQCLDYDEQMDNFVQFFITDILPGIIFIISIKNKKDIRLVFKVLAIVSIINCSYGILSFVTNSNPYLDYLTSRYGDIDNDSYKNLRVSIWTASTFVNSNCWGYFLPIAFVLMFFAYKKEQNKLYLYASILLSIGVFICGKRSAIIAYVSFWLAYFLLASRQKRFRYILITVALGCGAIALLYIFPQLDSVRAVFESSMFFWDDSVSKANDIEGSSMELRIRQVVYPWTEIKKNLVFGHGFGWCKAYLQRYELHPQLYGFETIFSTAVCEGGFVGVFTWIWVFFMSYKYTILRTKDKMFPILFTFVQIVIAISTGLSYFFFYCVFIAMLYKYIRFCDDSHIEIKRNKRKKRLAI